MESCRIYMLESKEDDRGWLFSLPDESLRFLGTIQEVHVGTVGHLKVRGNHVHPHRKEVLFVRYQSSWDFYWQLPDDKEPRHESILGTGAVIVEIPQGVAHTLYNPGSEPLIMAAFSDQKFVPDSDDTQRIILF